MQSLESRRVQKKLVGSVAVCGSVPQQPLQPFLDFVEDFTGIVLNHVFHAPNRRVQVGNFGHQSPQLILV